MKSWIFAAMLALPAPIALAGNDGIDYSANPITLGGLALITTIPAKPGRLGLELMISCPAGGIVVLDDADEKAAPTLFPLAGSSSEGAQGAMYSNRHHTGRVRVFSANAACHVPARAW